MSKKNQIQVVIDGKILVISGYESEEYIQRVSYYINSSWRIQKDGQYRRQSDDSKKYFNAA